jgi:hypothetical protein
MKFSIFKSCFDTTYKFNNEIATFEQKKEFLIEGLKQIEDESKLNSLLHDISYFIMLTSSEYYDSCGSCGDNNSYEEFEL